MKVIGKIVSAATFSFLTAALSFQSLALEIVSGSGNPAEKLILDWSNSKPGNKNNSVRFNSGFAANDLNMLQNGKIDFAILDAPLSEADLSRMNLLQFPFALNGISIVVNLQNTLAGTLRLDGQTLGKIFSGEITKWDEPAITALNPKHDLAGKTITIIHSGDTSADYASTNSYLAGVNDKWRAGDAGGRKREWPANSIYADGMANRLATLQKTAYSIAYLPMQHHQQAGLTTVHLKNKDGNFVGLSDTSILATTSTADIEEGKAASLSLINKSGRSSWPISTFTFVVVAKNSLTDEKVAQTLSVIGYGLKSASLKTTVHNYILLPDKISHAIIAKIESLPAATSSTARVAPVTAAPEKAPVEVAKPRPEVNAAEQEERIRMENKQRARLAAEEQAKEQALKQAKADKLAAEEALKAAAAAKLQAEQLAEKNRLIAKAEKDRADKEKADKEKAEKEKERAIQLRNQKDEDPLEAYRRENQ
jgi:phosphate transport system substrate-binding protein